MDRDVLRHRVSVTIGKTSLFKLVENILEEGKVGALANTITEYLMGNRYSRDQALEYISDYLESELEKAGIDLEDDIDGVSLAVLFVYEEMLENKQEFFSKIQERSAHVAPLADSGSEE